MRCDLDGSNVETLVQTGRGEDDRRDETRWCVGVAVDPVGGHLYWTQKGPSDAGLGKILRAGVDLPAGEGAAGRGDIEVLFEGLPEPIDLELDLAEHMLYWTDRGDPPRGNSVNRAPMDPPDGRRPPQILLTHLMEGIGLALDPDDGRMYVTDLAGNVYAADLDGSNRTEILVLQGNLTGIARAVFAGRDECLTDLRPVGQGPGGLSRGVSSVVELPIGPEVSGFAVCPLARGASSGKITH